MIPPSGPVPARVMIVGEAPGADEERKLMPFVGASGMELDRMLHEAGILRSECFVTNVVRIRPPSYFSKGKWVSNDVSQYFASSKKQVESAPAGTFTLLRNKNVKQPVVDGYRLLQSEISMANPHVVIALGNTALWALTGKWGILRWRGSMLRDDSGRKVIPTIHPAAVLREWSFRAIAVHDLRRAQEYISGQVDYPDPQWKFIIRPNYAEVYRVLCWLLESLRRERLRLSFDLETAHGHIDCAGIAWSTSEGICIPFLAYGRDYWSADQEVNIVSLLRDVLTHPNVEVVGQNLLYDCQYTYRHWLFIPRVNQDTMISWHVAFLGMKKKLDFQASMLCKHYVQWKPDRTKEKEGG